ncbi:hypothetical protein TNCV_3770341 [Trichonephila clavipes]|nr:hypothetical protein TNCV_3770341 [Trichonephila clavipes]
MKRTTPELASPLQTTTPRQWKDFEARQIERASNTQKGGSSVAQRSNSGHAGHEFVTITPRLLRPSNLTCIKDPWLKIKDLNSLPIVCKIALPTRLHCGGKSSQSREIRKIDVRYTEIRLNLDLDFYLDRQSNYALKDLNPFCFELGFGYLDYDDEVILGAF